MTMDMNWIAIGDITDIPLRGARCVKTPQGKIAVFRTAENEVFAIEDHCPHKGGPLSQGILHGDTVSCPLHNWRISLRSGQAQGEDKGCTPAIPLKIDGGRIFLQRDAVLGLTPA